ncbi:hypothetical protein ACMHYB_39160 [Sorangium sp. So ce1128]
MSDTTLANRIDGFCSWFERGYAADCSCIQETDAACACTGDAETGVMVDCSS